jgi:hypothetical protein
VPEPSWLNNLAWIARSVVPGKLRLHPADEVEVLVEPSVAPPERRPFAGCNKKVLLALAIGVGIGLLVKLHFVSTRYYQAEGRIAIENVSEAGRSSAMKHHLANLQNGNDATLMELMKKGVASVFALDEQTISVRVSDRDVLRAYSLARGMTQNYVTSVVEKQTIQSRQMTGDQAKLLTVYGKLQGDRETLKKQADEIKTKLPSGELGEYLGKMSGQMQARIGASNSLVDRMNQINIDINHYRGEVVHPTISVDQARLDAMKNADRRYHGDYVLLAGKHEAYVGNLKTEMDAMEQSLGELRGHLSAISAATTKQLELKLPSDLSDDLLEMNLAVEKYDGQIAHFSERWTRYREKLIELIGAPASADFDGLQTLLSQLRQDLQQRCASMPTHLDGLYRQVQQGQQGKSGMSGVTARNVASSAVAGEIENGLESWRQVTLHMNRMFPDGNVNLLTLGRLCRSVQWRLNFREKQIRQDLEEQQIAACKREAQLKVDSLQKEFETTSGKLVGAFGEFSKDQQTMVQISKEWPRLEKVQQAMGLIDREMASIEGELNSDPAKRISQEKIEALPVLTRECNYAGISTGAENKWAGMLGLIGLLTAMGIMMPGDCKQCLVLGGKCLVRTFGKTKSRLSLAMAKLTK